MGDFTDQLDEFMNKLPMFITQVETSVADWSTREFVGEADEGRITANVSAVGELRSINIHLLSKRKLDNISLAEAIVTAILAGEEAAATAKSAMLSSLSIGDTSLGKLLEDGSKYMEKWASIPGGLAG